MKETIDDANVKPAGGVAARLAGLVLGATLAAAPLATAGGPGVLRLPVEGVTEANAGRCAEVLRERLGGYLAGLGEQDVTVEGTGAGATFSLCLGTGRLSLEDLERTFADTPFRIERQNLEFFGAVRVTCGGVPDGAAVAAALNPDPAEVSVLTRPAGDSTVEFIVGDVQRSDGTLFTYRDLEEATSRQGVRLAAVSWGYSPDLDRDGDDLCWHCRRAYGARRAGPTEKTRIAGAGAVRSWLAGRLGRAQEERGRDAAAEVCRVARPSL